MYSSIRAAAYGVLIVFIVFATVQRVRDSNTGLQSAGWALAAVGLTIHSALMALNVLYGIQSRLIVVALALVFLAVGILAYCYFRPDVSDNSDLPEH